MLVRYVYIDDKEMAKKWVVTLVGSEAQGMIKAILYKDNRTNKVYIILIVYQKCKNRI